jgi:5-methylcytosine-specific restriction endonuclease McrA
MTLSDRLPVACSQRHAWPMALAGPPVGWQNPNNMIFRCSRCGQRETFKITREDTLRRWPIAPSTRARSCG